MTLLKAQAMLLIFAATPCKAECHVDHFNFYHGSEVPATMHTTSGAPCSIKFTNGRNSNIDSIAITGQPKHGAVTWNGLNGSPAVLYKSSPGYKGSDDFSFDISGTSKRSTSPASVRVSVDVH